MDNKISIIIPCFNEEKNIGKCLESIFNQNYNNFEVIVVDNNSNDNSIKMASLYPVTILEEPKVHNVSAVRNKGIINSNGEIIVTIDADCELKQGFLKMIADRFSDKSIHILAFPNSAEGSTEFHKQRTVVPDTTIYIGKSKTIMQKLVALFYGYHGAPAGFIAFRKSAFIDVGGYDEHCFPFGGEDYDIFFKIISQYKYSTILPDETNLIKEKRTNQSGFYRFVRWNYRTAEARINLYYHHKKNMANPIIKFFFLKAFIHIAASIIFVGLLLAILFNYSYLYLAPIFAILLFFYYSKRSSKHFVRQIILYGIVGIIYTALTYISALFNFAIKRCPKKY